jgi:hypothetical protein
MPVREVLDKFLPRPPPHALDKSRTNAFVKSPKVPDNPTPVPASGNLKLRTLRLSEDIEQKMDGRRRLLMPNPRTREDVKALVKSESHYFRWEWLPDVKSIHEEFAQLHIRNQDLDDFLKFEQMDEDAQKFKNERGLETNPTDLWPETVSRVVQDLRQLAGQLPN